MVHFTVEQRYKLEVLLQQNVCKEQIAIELGKHISSIYREIKRNSDERNTVYKANLASRKSKKRHKEKLKNQCFNIEIQTVKNYGDDLLVSKRKVTECDLPWSENQFFREDEIGRACVGKECRSRWSPYH